MPKAKTLTEGEQFLSNAIADIRELDPHTDTVAKDFFYKYARKLSKHGVHIGRFITKSDNCGNDTSEDWLMSLTRGDDTKLELLGWIELRDPFFIHTPLDGFTLFDVHSHKSILSFCKNIPENNHVALRGQCNPDGYFQRHASLFDTSTASFLTNAAEILSTYEVDLGFCLISKHKDDVDNPVSVTTILPNGSQYYIGSIYKRHDDLYVRFPYEVGYYQNVCESSSTQIGFIQDILDAFEIPYDENQLANEWGPNPTPIHYVWVDTITREWVVSTMQPNRFGDGGSWRSFRVSDVNDQRVIELPKESVRYALPPQEIVDSVISHDVEVIVRLINYHKDKFVEKVKSSRASDSIRYGNQMILDIDRAILTISAIPNIITTID